MLLRLMLILGAALFAVSAHAGASTLFEFSDSVSGGDEKLHLIEVDFGDTPATFDIELYIADTLGNGIRVNLIDLNGPFNGSTEFSDEGNDDGNDIIELSLTTPEYTGIQYFIVAVETYEGAGVSEYSAEFFVLDDLGSGAIAEADTRILKDIAGVVQTAFGRAAVMRNTEFGDETEPFELVFDVDFGATDQTAELLFSASGEGMEKIELFELGGTPELLVTLDANEGEIDDGELATTSERSGRVTFRVVVTPDVDFSGRIDWVCVFDDSVTVLEVTEYTEAFSGSVNPDSIVFFAFDVDYGQTERSLRLDAMVEASGGDIEIILVDLGLAAEDVEANWVADSPTIEDGERGGATMFTPARTGVHRFAVIISHEDEVAVTIDFINGTFSVFLPDDSAEDITPAGGPVALGADSGPTTLFSRLALQSNVITNGDPMSTLIQVDFGATDQAIDFSLFVPEAENIASVRLYEISETGEADLLVDLDDAGAQATSSERSGIVTFRVVIAPNDEEAEFFWLMFFPDTVEVLSAESMTPSVVPFSGSVQAGRARFMLFAVDYGDTETALDLKAQISATGGDNFSLALVDLDAASSFSGEWLVAEGTGDGSDISVLMATPERMGLRQFVVAVFNNDDTTINFSGDLRVLLPATPNVISGGTTTITPDDGKLHVLFQRVALREREITNGNPVVTTVEVNFGDTPQSIDFGLMLNGQGLTAVTVYEINEAGAAVQLDQITTTNPEEETLVLSSSTRSGTVRFIVDVEPAGTSAEYSWVLFFPDTVTVRAPDSKKKSSGGCVSNRDGGPGWLILLAMLGMLAAGAKLARPREA